jgi:GTP-binding protein
MKITSAEFITSAVRQNQYPPDTQPEVAFAGRSNVGKSSLINTLVNRKNLVKTSARPGRTQTLNFFLINKQYRFVDLPGYGFAEVPLSVRAGWKGMVEEYLGSRRSLKLVVLILDVRRDPGSDDASLMRWLEAAGKPFLAVLTKADKLSKNVQQAQHRIIQERLLLKKEEMILFSAVTHQGRLEVLHYIAGALSRTRIELD